MFICRSDDEDDNPMNTEEVKKPSVIVDNKPLTRINCADDDDKEEKPANSNLMNKNQEKKKKKKKKSNNGIASSIGNNVTPEVSQSTSKTDSKIASTKTETVVKPSTQTQPISQPILKSSKPKTSKIEKAQVNRKDRLSKVAHKTIDKRNKQPNKQKLSDERLKAFGINPKKFVKQQKYAARNNQQNPLKTNKKSPAQAAAQSKQKIKLKNKLKKVLKST